MSKTFIPAFEAIVAKFSDNAAIVDSGVVVYSYRQLADRARYLADALHASGVKRGDVVGISIAKSPDYICAMLAIWYAGAAFVPMDPALPLERLQFMAAEADVKVVLIAAISRLSDVARLVCLDLRTLQEQNLAESAAASRDLGLVDDLNVTARQYLTEYMLDDLAYVIFTSGSTGRPKGVLVTHRGIVNLLDAQIAAFDLHSESRSLWYLSTSFDASVSDLGIAFLSGAAIYIEASERMQPGSGLEEILRDRAITYVDIPPSILRLLDPTELPASLKTIVIGGEACALDVVRSFAAKVKLVNVYGPTESTVCTSLGQCHEDWDRPLIGLPLPGISYLVLDDQLNECGANQPGQLHIGGIGLARGYLNRPDLTDAKFILRPSTGERLYCTGDLVMRTEDDQYQFLGRTDRQVKLRGMLVEPEEIESRLLEYGGVKRTAVLKRSIKAGISREILVAFVEANVGTAELEIETLRQHLAEVLPKWMLPQRIELIDVMPLTVTGKVDLNALKTWPLASVSASVSSSSSAFSSESESKSVTGSGSASANTSVASGASAIERVLEQVYKQVLGVDDATSNSDFYDLGGDSFAVVEACVVASALGLALPPTLLITTPVLNELAVKLQSLSANSVSAAGGMLCLDIMEDIRLTQDFEELVGQAEKRADTPQDATAEGASPGNANTIFLTGATGFLGARLLHELASRDVSAKIFCLVRAENESQGRQRVEQALAKHGLTFASIHGGEERIVIVCGDLSQPRFGVEDSHWLTLSSSIDTVYHCAAQVNNLASYDELRQSNIGGTIEVIRLLCSGRRKVLHYISTLSVFVATDRNSGVLLEADQLQETSVVYGGYAQTKWGAEMLLRSLSGRTGEIRHYRLGLITGDSITGLSAEHDFLNLFIGGLAALGAAPSVKEDISLDITPVDFAARAIVALANNSNSAPEQTFHIANSQSLTLRRLLKNMHESGLTIEIVEPDAFRKLLLSRVSMLGGAAAAACMALCRLTGEDFEYFRTMDLFQATDVVFDTTNSSKILDVLNIKCPAPSDQLVQLYLQQLR